MRRRSVRPWPIVLVVVALALPSAALWSEAHPTPHGAVRTGGAGGPTGPPAFVTVAPAFESGSARDLGSLPAAAIVHVLVALAPRDPAGLRARTILEYTPGSLLYRQFLTPGEIADQYGPSPGDYRNATSFFSGLGLTVSAGPDRTLLSVSGPSSRVAQAFHTSFHVYRSDGRTFYAHPTPATLPAGIGWGGALGLGNQSGPRPYVSGPVRPIPIVPRASCSSSGALLPCQIQSAYNLSGLESSGKNGSGFTIGVVDTYDGVESQPQLASDLGSFASSIGVPLGTVNYLYPVPTSKNLNNTSTGWSLEEALDVEWARAMAPGATIDMTFAPDPTTGLYASVDWLVAHHSVDVLSLSWGEPDVGLYNSFMTPCATQCNASTDGSYTLLLPVLAAAAAEGIGVFAASGDCGAAEGTNATSTSYPASDPSATGVGGTVLSLGSGNSYLAETGWSGNASGSSAPGCANQGGSGGGYSPLPRPWWQSMTGLPTNPAGRGVPDVSIDAGTGVAIVYQGSSGSVGGTSAGTPMWAGIEAIADQVAGKALGSLDPSLYSLARGANYRSLFHDVTTGSNGYHAGAGWDPVTGLGSPNGSALVPALAAGPGTPPGFTGHLFASPRFVATGSVVRFTANASGGSSPYPLVDIAFGDGNASLAPAGSASHAYRDPGVYLANSAFIDRTGNSTISAPVAIVVGGGGPLNVSLAVTPTSAAVGQSVTLTPTVLGGQGTIRYTYSFGDGTYLANTTLAPVHHSYGSAGSFCPAVVARDSAARPNGGASLPVPVSIAGGTSPPCLSSAPLSVALTSAFSAADLPADFPLVASARGGNGAVTVQYSSDDPYVAACECGIFRTAGTHTIRAYANDSLNEEATSTLSVTTYPALLAQFSVSAQSGVGPITVTFRAAAGGGHLADAARTNWSFGDGTFAVGSSVQHTYSAAGSYLGIGRLSDQGHGNASEAFTILVWSSAPPAAPWVVANVSSAMLGYAGGPVQFQAAVGGGVGPLTVHWDLGAGDSAFGTRVAESYAKSGCVGDGSCPLRTTVSVTDSRGATGSQAIVLAPFLGVRENPIGVSDSFSPSSGTTPLAGRGSALVTGMAGLRIGWIFGDGGSANGTSAAHIYHTAGNFTVVETISDPQGDVFLRSHAVAVTGSTVSGPAVGGGPSVGYGLVPLTVSFSATASGGAGAPYRYNWTFGDGANATGANTTHVYNRTGQFVAQVVVTDRIGDVTSRSFPISVYRPTPVGIALSTLYRGGPKLLVHAVLALACTSESVPGCSAAQVVVRLTYTTSGGDPYGGAGPLPSIAFPASGQANVTIAAPTTIGAYELLAAAQGPNYTGSARLGISVPWTGLFSFSAPPPWILLAAVASGTAVGVAALVRRPGRANAGGTASP